MRPTSKKFKKSSIKIAKLKWINLTTARIILRDKSTVKYNKNCEHSNRKPKNGTRINLKENTYRMKQTVKLPK